MNWVEILQLVIMILFGGLATYFKTKTELLDAAKDKINQAEDAYKDATKAGGEKFAWVSQQVYSLVPAFLKPIITQDTVDKLVQKVYDKMAEFAAMQIDKAVNKATEKISKKDE